MHAFKCKCETLCSEIRNFRIPVPEGRIRGKPQTLCSIVVFPEQLFGHCVWQDGGLSGPQTWIHTFLCSYVSRSIHALLILAWVYLSWAHYISFRWEPKRPYSYIVRNLTDFQELYMGLSKQYKEVCENKFQCDINLMWIGLNEPSTCAQKPKMHSIGKLMRLCLA